MNGSSRLPTFYIPHGGGPCFFIKPEDLPPAMSKNTWHPMEAYLRSIDALVGRRPKAVLVITAHWITARPTVGTAAVHHLLFDYYGFPPYTYELTYPVRGAPDVAARVVELLAEAGIESDMDDTRGIDHGVFIPFKLIYPDANVPIVPMSLRQGLRGIDHIEIGKALAQLRDEDVLIVGSGMSFHNMRAIMTGTHDAESAEFDAWLSTTVQMENTALRDTALGAWESSPSARAAHPEEEHLIPLMVAAGAAGADIGRRTYGGQLGGKRLSGFTFG